jgi:hypothetical protein
MSFIPEAITSLAPYAECYLAGDGLDGLEWLDENIDRPTDAAILAEAARLEALAPTAVKLERNRRLAVSDWTQMSDVPMSGELRTEWAIYRQALRDLDVSGTDFAAVAWPTPPA